MQSGHDVGLSVEVPGTPRHPADEYRPGYLYRRRPHCSAKIEVSGRSSGKAALVTARRSL
jgi:hypothetical protein